MERTIIRQSIANILNFSLFISLFTLNDINTLKVKPSEIIACREDLYNYYMSNGSKESEAVKEMDNVRKGIHKSSILPIATKNTIKDNWVISLCEEVLYLPSKTEIIEDIVFLPNEL